jgi:hypothetical protein
LIAKASKGEILEFETEKSNVGFTEKESDVLRIGETTLIHQSITGLHETRQKLNG